ncbi:MAG: SIR2 family NAD-dependent protein deacylase [Solirubrobacterales bacterium]
MTVTAAHEQLAEQIRASRSTVVLTGAGISVPSGIPDFRSPGTGLWANVDPMEVAHINVFRGDPQRFWSFYRPRFGMLGDKEPNDAHHAVAELERRGLVDGVITQNIDRLHRKAGSRELIEVHGSIATSSCQVCGHCVALEEAEALFADGVLPCPECGGPVKPDVVLFGEMLDEESMSRAFALAAAAELILCVGSSLEVHPVAGLPAITLRGGGRVALITQGATPYDGEATVRLDHDVVSDLGAVLEALDA